MTDEPPCMAEIFLDMWNEEMKARRDAPILGGRDRDRARDFFHSSQHSDLPPPRELGQ